MLSKIASSSLGEMYLLNTMALKIWGEIEKAAETMFYTFINRDYDR